MHIIMKSHAKTVFYPVGCQNAEAKAKNQISNFFNVQIQIPSLA